MHVSMSVHVTRLRLTCSNLGQRRGSTQLFIQLGCIVATLQTSSPSPATSRTSPASGQVRGLEAAGPSPPSLPVTPVQFVSARTSMCHTCFRRCAVQEVDVRAGRPKVLSCQTHPMAPPSYETVRQSVNECYGQGLDSSTPLFERRLLCHVGAKVPDLRKAKTLSPSVRPTPASQQASAQASGSSAPRQSAGGSSAEATAPATPASAQEQSVPAPSTPPPQPAPSPADASASNDPHTTAAPPQFTDDDPDSPYAIHQPLSQDALLRALDAAMMRGFDAVCWRHGAWLIPGFPRTASAAAELQTQIDQLAAQGEDLRAFPWLCQMAMYSAYALGANHSDTVQAVYRVTQSLHQRLEYDTVLHAWLLSQAARQWGLSHPDTRRLVEQAADILSRVSDPRQCTSLTKTATNIAKHLPGGLGWGTCIIASIDEDAYNRHAVMQAKAASLLFRVYDTKDIHIHDPNLEAFDRALKTDRGLAKQMLERCVAYWESVGPHWLASARRVRSMQWLAIATARAQEGHGVPMVMLYEAKRIAQKELGRTHPETLQCTQMLAETLGANHLSQDNVSRALPVFRKVLRLREEVLGPRHYSSFETKAMLGKLLSDGLKLDDEAETLLRETFDEGHKTLGRSATPTSDAQFALWCLLGVKTKRFNEACAFRDRSEKMGYVGFESGPRYAFDY